MNPTAVRRLGVVCVALALVSTISGRAAACSCTNYPDFQRAFNESDAIFRGVVQSVTPAPTDNDQAQIQLLVNARWKGNPPDLVTILTPAHDGVCGVTFEVGEEYLVYAFDQPFPQLWTHSCWRTHMTDETDPDIALLDSTPSLRWSWGKIKALYRD